MIKSEYEEDISNPKKEYNLIEFWTYENLRGNFTLHKKIMSATSKFDLLPLYQTQSYYSNEIDRTSLKTIISRGMTPMYLLESDKFYSRFRTVPRNQNVYLIEEEHNFSKGVKLKNFPRVVLNNNLLVEDLQKLELALCMEFTSDQKENDIINNLRNFFQDVSSFEELQVGTRKLNNLGKRDNSISISHSTQ